MTPLIGALSVLLALGAAHPAHTHGRRVPPPKKYYIANNNQKNMKLVNERAVDSYFRILKSSLKSFATLPVNDRRYTQIGQSGDGRNEPSNRRHQSIEKHPSRDADHPTSTANTNSVLNPNNGEQLKLKQKEYFTKNNVYQKPESIGPRSRNSHIESNVHKLTSELNDRRPRPAQNFYQKMPSSRVKDKVLHKANVNNDRSAQMMRRRLNEIMHRDSLEDREYRKRHALAGAPAAALRNGDGGKERSLRKIGKHHMPARIGNFDVGREIRAPPYALFYRMNHEDVVQPEQLASYARGVPYYGDGAGAAAELMSADNSKVKPYSAFRDR